VLFVIAMTMVQSSSVMRGATVLFCTVEMPSQTDIMDFLSCTLAHVFILGHKYLCHMFGSRCNMR
jgi:hypothetical protein